jgi:hypothetical protein
MSLATTDTISNVENEENEVSDSESSYLSQTNTNSKPKDYIQEETNQNTSDCYEINAESKANQQWTLDADSHEEYEAEGDTNECVVRSSSYEDIYIGTKFPGEESYEDDVNVDFSSVGDPFKSSHVESHLMTRQDGKSSSFENLYDATDESNTIGQETVSFVVDNEDDEEERCPIRKPAMSLDFEKTLMVGSPIDITMESGLDKIGHGECEKSMLLQHSMSYNVDDVDYQQKKQRRHSTGSTPDEIDIAIVEKNVESVNKGSIRKTLLSIPSHTNYFTRTTFA